MEISFPSPPVGGMCEVSGRVRQQDSSPVQGVIVRAFDIDLRTELPLGETRTDAQGSYKIQYSVNKLARPGKTAADLVMRAFQPDGTLLAESPLAFHAPSTSIVNLIAHNLPYLGPSRFQSITTAIAPSLQNITPDTLTVSDISYLAGDTGLPITTLQNYADAAKNAVSSGVSHEAFFGMAAAGLPTDTESLLAARPEALQVALQLASGSNQIGPDITGKASDIANALHQQALSALAASSTDPSMQSLAFALPDVKARATFLQTMDQYKEDPGHFWDALGKTSAFQNADQLKRVQFTLQAASLTCHNIPLIQELLRMHDANEVTDLKSLAGWSVDKWQTLLNAAPPAIPTAAASASGVSSPLPEQNANQQQRSRTAQEIADSLETAFPTSAIAAQIGSSSIPNGADAANFLNSNSEFDIMTASAAAYTGAVKADPQVASLLKTVQRVYRAAPLFRHTEALINAGMKSARDISRQPKALFVSKMEAAAGGSAEAEAIYARAQTITMTALNVFTRFSPVLNKGSIPFLNLSLDLSKTQIADWPSLFGSADYCSCRHCRSVLSPAAYMVDLLHEFVDVYISDTHGNTGTELLFNRRPDINTMQLSCRNTNTTLPWIDLVNELLENLVSPGTAAAHDSTDGDPDSLAAMPEYINHQAYAILSAQAYPWQLPFSLQNAQAGLYLANLKLQRRQIMKALSASENDADPSQPAITMADSMVCDALGINYLSWQIITGANTGHPVNELWGVSAADWAASWITPAGPTVDAFLKQSGILFAPPADTQPTPDNPNPPPAPPFNSAAATLLELLESGFLQSLAAQGKPIQIQWAGNDFSSCDLSQAYIINLSEKTLGSILQFLRLQKVMNISVPALDQMYAVINPNGITPAFLQQAVAIQDLQAQLKMPLPDLLTWWGDIPVTADASGATSLYARLFQNPSLSNPLDPAFLLNAAGTELQTAGQALEDHADMLQSALQLSAADLQLLLQGLNLPLLSPKKHTMNLASLSMLFRAVSLSKALNLQITDMLTAARLTPFDLTLNASSPSSIAPFDASHLKDIPSLMDMIGGSGFQIPELAYLLQDQGASTSTLAPANADIASQLAGIQQKIISAPDQAAQALAKWLKLDSVQTSLLLQQMAPGFPDTGINILTYPGFVGDSKIVPTEALIASSIAATTAPANPSADSSFYYQTRLLILLTKCSVVISRLKINQTELQWLLTQNNGYLNPLSMPVAGSAPSSQLFAALSSLAQIYSLRNALISGLPFTALFPTGGSEKDFLSLLSAITGWNNADLTYLASAPGINSTYPGDFFKPDAFKRLYSAFTILTTLQPGGLIAQKAKGWIGVDLTSDQSSEIAAIVKTTYSIQQWAAVGPTIRNPLRQRQRDALTAYVLYNSQTIFGQSFTIPDDLYSYLLIDVEMSSCMLTSRIVQATMSIQLFVIRSLMNLETDIIVAPGAEEIWTWMSQYRVWEANRQIFLYPENWMDPELRDDKSPFFLDLEKDVKKNPATKDVMEQVYLRYLNSLDSVARLEVCGMYHDYRPDLNVDNLHVFARTIGASPTYYYRQFQDGYSWTAWEKVDLDIGGVDVIPVIYNRRLFLYWPIFSVIADQPDTLQVPDANESGFPVAQPNRYVQVKMAWSEYTQDKWTAKSVSKAKPLQVSAVMSSPTQEQVVLNPDHSVDPGWFAFKAFPFSSAELDLLMIQCFVRISLHSHAYPAMK